MDFGAEARNEGDAVVLTLGGKLLYGDACDALRGDVLKLLDDGKKKLVLNLEELRFIDSSGLGCIVSCYTTAKRKGGLLKLVKPTGQVRKALAWTRISMVIKPYDDDAQAVASFD